MLYLLDEIKLSRLVYIFFFLGAWAFRHRYEGEEEEEREGRSSMLFDVERRARRGDDVTRFLFLVHGFHAACQLIMDPEWINV